MRCIWLMLLLLGSGLIRGQQTLFQLYGKKTEEGVVEYKNAPASFMQDNRRYQHVIASYTSDTTGRLRIRTGAKVLLDTVLRRGNNRFLLSVPAVSHPRHIGLTATVDDRSPVTTKFLLQPVRAWEVDFIQHTHTDIGYTRPQSEVLAEQMRYIDYALDFCDQTDHLPDEAKFRWTCEAAWVTRGYLRSRPASQIERLKKRIAEGRIEVTGMLFNMAEVAEENIMTDFLAPLRDFQEAGIPVRTAMQNDVNGVAWCMPDYFRNTGVKYLTMGINETRSILPFDKPTPFWWESPSGERLLAFRAEHYMTGNFFGIETASPEFGVRMLWYLADLLEKGYTLDRVAVQYSGYFTDNAPPSTVGCQVIADWNSRYEYPRLRHATMQEFLGHVEKQYVAQLPVYRNAWLDWWTDGFASISRETAEIRHTQSLKLAGEGLLAMVSLMDGKLPASIARAMAHVSENALFFDEHTVSADESISRPKSANTTRQWLQKGAYAWEALKQVTLLNEEALARFQPFLPRSDRPLIYIINTLGWQRTADAEVFVDYELLPLDRPVQMVDMETGRPVVAQVLQRRKEGAYWKLRVENVPAMGVKALQIIPGTKVQSEAQPAGDGITVMENRFYRIEIDPATGGLARLLDKELQLELVDAASLWKPGQPILEELTSRSNMKPTHSSVFNVRIREHLKGPFWQSLRVGYDMRGFERTEGGHPMQGIEAEVRLYEQEKKLEIRYTGLKEMVSDPQGVYVAFPFNLPGGRIFFETIGGTVAQGDQLPGSSSDWNAAQDFVSIRGARGQVIIVSPELPLWQFSDLNIGKFERYPKQGRPWLFSWVMNNYWFTNFRAWQEGAFSWSYIISSSADTTNAYAARYARSLRTPLLSRPLPVGKGDQARPLIETLRIQAPEHVIVAGVRPVFENEGPSIRRIRLHLRELEGREARVSLRSAIPGSPLHSLIEVDITGRKLAELGQEVVLPPFGVRFVELSL